jgi:hypothetical protein
MTASIEDLLRQAAEKKRLEEELRIAHEIQMSLLPQGPLLMEGLSVTALCVPAREVGGDYYDFLPLGDQRVGVLIADVSGKGTSAALYMAELKGLVLSLSEIHTSPRDLLIAANRIIAHHLDARSFITMTYAIIDLRARTMTYARAGHTPLIYVPGVCAQGTPRQVQILVPDGMVVGLKLDNGEMFARHLVEETIALQPGDLYLLFTDGISEAMNARDDLFGETRLGQLVESPRAPAVRGAPRAHAARDRGVCRRCAAARRHDDDPGEGRRDRRRGGGDRCTARRERGRPMTAVAPGRRACAACKRREGPRRHFPEPLRHRSADRPRPARSPRRHVGRLLRRAALGLPDVGRRPHRGAHRGPCQRGRRGAAASSKGTGPSSRAARWCACATSSGPLQQAIGYRFRDRGLLEHAMTHTSRRTKT